MSDPSRTSYVPRHDVTAEDEVELLAEVYSFVLRCAEEKEAAGEDGGEDDAKGGSKNGSQVRWNIQQP